MLHLSLRTADKFAEEYDCFGDSYTHNSTPESLKEIFDKVRAQVRGLSNFEMLTYYFYQNIFTPL